MTATKALLDDLGAADLSRMRDAFAAVERQLAKRAFTDDELERLATAVAGLAASPRWQTRKAVARCLRYMRSDATSLLLARLAADENDLVAKEAERSAKHRLERVHVGQLPAAVDGRMQRALGELERHHSLRTRDAAIRVGLAYTEFMVDAMNHQVKTAMMPIGASLLALEELLRRAGDERALSFVRSASTQLDRAQSVLSRSLQYVKRAPAPYKATPLRELVEGAITAARGYPPAPTNGLAPVVDVPKDLELEVEPNLLREAIDNLLKNAVEASAARRPIPLHVAARRREGNVELTIRDEGCGMTQEECDHAIWRPYGSKKRGGTGLGMPLAKKLIEVDHGGKIHVTSQPGAGATVTIFLPALQRF